MPTRSAGIVLCMLLSLAGVCLPALSQRPSYPLKVSANGRYFTDGTGKPFLYQAHTSWQLFARLTLAEARDYLALRKSQGFNSLQVMFSVNPDSLNRAGQAPFLAYDFTRPNDAYFTHVEHVIRSADSLGLLLNIAPFWTGCCRESYGVGAKVEMYARSGIDRMRQLGKWMGGRFGRYKNIIWTMGGDNDPLSIRREIEALAESLHAAAPHQLITFHARPPHSSTDLFQYAPWLGYSMVYSYWREKPNWYVNPEQMPHVYEVSLREYLKSDRMPFILGESQYEGFVHNMASPHASNDIGSPLHVRRQAWWTLLCGATGHAYGDNGWFFPPNWRTIAQYPGAGQMQHVIRFFEALPWWDLVPDYRHEVLLQGYGDYTKDNYATAAVTGDSTVFVAYRPQPGPLTVDLSKLKGPYVTARWYDPRTGQYSEGERFRTEGVKKLYSPLQEDWVLVLTTDR